MNDHNHYLIADDAETAAVDAAVPEADGEPSDEAGGDAQMQAEAAIGNVGASASAAACAGDGSATAKPPLDPVAEALARARIIAPEQVALITAYAESHGLRFGDAAIALGYIDQDMLDKVSTSPFGLFAADSGWDGEPVAFTQPNSAAAEDFRSIRNALALRWFKHPQGEKTLAVISPDRGEGRTLMAANLAVCCAQVGFRTLLVDADMRNPAQHRLFNLGDVDHGLSSYLADRWPVPEFRAIPSLPTLSVLPAGGIPPNPQELLLRGRLDQLVEQSKAAFEMIIFDTPAAMTGGDYQIIGAAAKGALIVTQQARTHTKAAKHLVDQCRGFGIRVVGGSMMGAG